MNEKLIEAVRQLRPYIHHSMVCDAFVLKDGRCTCGLEDVLTLLLAPKEKP